MTIGARARPNQLMSAARSCTPPVAAGSGGRPEQSEQPRPHRGSPHRPSCRRVVSDPRTQIRQGDPAHRLVPSTAREARR
jgi:hypothetical protein